MQKENHLNRSKKNYVRGLRLPKPPSLWEVWPPTPPDAFRLNLPSQLVSVSESGSQKSSNPQFTTDIEYKIDHIIKTKYHKKKITN